MTNHHSRLKQLEKLSAQQKVQSRTKAEKIESDRLQATVAELTNEELKARYETTMEEIRNKPIDPAIVNLTTEQLISKYTQLCKES